MGQKKGKLRQLGFGQMYHPGDTVSHARQHARFRYFEVLATHHLDMLESLCQDVFQRAAGAPVNPLWVLAWSNALTWLPKDKYHEEGAMPWIVETAMDVVKSWQDHGACAPLDDSIQYGVYSSNRDGVPTDFSYTLLSQFVEGNFEPCESKPQANPNSWSLKVNDQWNVLRSDGRSYDPSSELRVEARRRILKDFKGKLEAYLKDVERQNKSNGWLDIPKKTGYRDFLRLYKVDVCGRIQEDLAIEENVTPQSLSRSLSQLRKLIYGGTIGLAWDAEINVH